MLNKEPVCGCENLHTDMADAVKKEMPKDAYFQKLSSFYKIVGDETRCKIIFILLDREMCVCDIANTLGMTKSSVSHQLAKMRSVGAVKYRKLGKEVYYSLDDSHIAEIFRISFQHISHTEVQYEK